MQTLRSKVIDLVCVYPCLCSWRIIYYVYIQHCVRERVYLNDNITRYLLRRMKCNQTCRSNFSRSLPLSLSEGEYMFVQAYVNVFCYVCLYTGNEWFWICILTCSFCEWQPSWTLLPGTTCGLHGTKRTFATGSKGPRGCIFTGKS
jgi:hypothetical protein